MRSKIAKLLIYITLLFSTSVQAVNLQELNELTKQFLRMLERSGKIIHEEESNLYLQRLGNRLSKNVRNKYDQYHFFLVNDNTINAFAGPGGYIGVHSGLILLAENEDELAGVIAHEMGHVKQHHMIRQLERMKAEKISMTLATLASIFLGAYSPELGQAAILTGAAGIQQMELNYSREQEAEADRIGIEILEKAHYSPYSLLTFFKRLLAQEQISIASMIPTMLKSHPLTEHRIAEIENRLHSKKQLRSPSVAFELFKAKIAFISQSNEPVHYKHAIAQDYADALMLLKNARYSDIEKMMPRLLAQKDIPAIKGFLIDYYGARGKPIRKGLIKKNIRYRNNEIITSKLFEYHLNQAHYAKATEIVQEALSETPTDPEVWFAYAELEAKQQHEAEAYLYRARGMYLSRKKFAARRLVGIAATKKTHYPYTKEKIKALQSELKRGK